MNDVKDITVREPMPMQQTEAETRKDTQPLEKRATAREMRVVEINSALAPAYAKAGTLELTPEETASLTAPFPDAEVEKRPHDGLFYIPHILISDRLTKVFGPGKWTMLRRWENIENNTIFAEWIMIVRGVYIGESVGAHQYIPHNPKMNYSDALESTRGEALRRIAAKYLSCGSQVWSPAYCRTLGSGPKPPQVRKPETQFEASARSSIDETQPQSPVRDQRVVVIDVRPASGTNKSNGKPWSAWFVVFEGEDGNKFEAGTFSKSVGEIAMAGQGGGRMLLVTKPGKKPGTLEITSLDPEIEVAPPQDDVAF